jgi:hypothetical protein
MKEREERESDGLDVPQISDDCSNRSESESSVSDDEHWTDESSLSASESESVASQPSLGTERSRSRERWSRALGLDDSLRKEVVGWMLDARVDLTFVNGLSDKHAGPSEHHSDAKRHRRN